MASSLCLGQLAWHWDRVPIRKVQGAQDPSRCVPKCAKAEVRWSPCYSTADSHAIDHCAPLIKWRLPVKLCTRLASLRGDHATRCCVQPCERILCVSASMSRRTLVVRNAIQQALHTVHTRTKRLISMQINRMHPGYSYPVIAHSCL